MNGKQNFKGIDLSKLTISQLHMCINSIYGDGKYINTPEYKEFYATVVNEIKNRTNTH